MSSRSESRIDRLLAVLVLGLCLYAPAPAGAQDIKLVIQTAMSPEDTRDAFGPLAEYLSEATGRPVKVSAAVNFLAHWEAMRRQQDYHLVMDAAHFTDFRAKRMGYEVLAKVPGALSFSIVTASQTLILDPEELLGRRVASLASPSLAAVRLVELFPDPVRTPMFVEVDDTAGAVEKVLSGDVLAAVIPTPMVQNFPDLNVVATTEQVPGIAVSASPSLDPGVRDAVRAALLEADKSEQGRNMLARVNLSGFEPASAATYDGYERLLEGTWGY